MNEADELDRWELEMRRAVCEGNLVGLPTIVKAYADEAGRQAETLREQGRPTADLARRCLSMLNWARTMVVAARSHALTEIQSLPSIQAYGKTGRFQRGAGIDA